MTYSYGEMDEFVTETKKNRDSLLHQLAHGKQWSTENFINRANSKEDLAKAVGQLANDLSKALTWISKVHNDHFTVVKELAEAQKDSDVSTKVETMLEKWKIESEEPLKNNIKSVVKEHLKEIVKETVESVAATEKFRKSFADAVKGSQDGIKKEAEKCFTKTLKASLKESQSEVIAQTVARQEADLYEKEKRARNVVIAGIPESRLSEISDRIEADKKFISTLADLPINKIEKCYRAGPPIGVGSNKDRTAPRRPVLLLPP
ncbi:MAG: hypothetical protein GY774_09900 [Planctomycetes bacterium]|nr:hypothetical protein [Planctomycetota bacterium]